MNTPRARPLPNLNAYDFLPAGWTDLFNAAVAALDDLTPGWQLTQVKEKYGGLRFYWWPPQGLPESTVQAASAAVAEAERRSFETCDVCGEPGSLRSDRNWWRTRCNTHAHPDVASVDADLVARAP